MIEKINGKDGIVGPEIGRLHLHDTGSGPKRAQNEATAIDRPISLASVRNVGSFFWLPWRMLMEWQVLLLDVRWLWLEVNGTVVSQAVPVPSSGNAAAGSARLSAHQSLCRLTMRVSYLDSTHNVLFGPLRMSVCT